MLQGTTRIYFIISGVIFGLVAIIHLIRALSNWAFVIGPITLPLSASWIGFIMTAVLCLWAIRLVISQPSPA